MSGLVMMKRNELQTHAKFLASSVKDSQWMYVLNEILGFSNGLTYEEFCNLMQDYLYYSALVCFCEGDEERVKNELKANYDEYRKQRMIYSGDYE